MISKAVTDTLATCRLRQGKSAGFLLLFFLLFLFSCKPKKRPYIDALPSHVHDNDSLPGAFQLGADWLDDLTSDFKVSADDTSAMREFYAARGDRFAWIHPEGIPFATQGFLDRLSGAADEGIRLKRTDPEALIDIINDYTDSLPAGFATQGLCSLEVALTAAWFDYASAAFSGLPEEHRKELAWFIPATQNDPVQLLHAYLADSLGGVPMNPLFHRLLPAVQRYRIVEGVDWGPPLAAMDPASLPLDPYRMSVLRRRLFLLGDLPDSMCGAGSTANAIRRFRIRHGLDAVSTPDTAMLRQLDVTPRERLLQLFVNLERCRWLPKEFTDRFILVNIPEFRMYVVSNDSLLWSTAVVVGKASTSTAIFSGRMKRVVLNPYWNVPVKILEEEILPELRKDPTWLSKHHFEVVEYGKEAKAVKNPIDWKTVNVKRFPYLVRQVPGNWNPLGKVKFIFPNSFDMYLHDTPSKRLFEENKRAFSHGCIRISAPDRLLSKVLEADPLWTPDAIEDVFEKRKEKRIELKREWPVFILYLTAWADTLGNVNFREDIYGHDSAMVREFYPDKQDW